MFSLQDDTGEVRAEAFYLRQETTFMVMFFPADRTAIPEALLSQLIKDSSANMLTSDDPDNYELQFREPVTQEGRTGSLTHFLTIRLRGGWHSRTSVHVTWKK